MSKIDRKLLQRYVEGTVTPQEVETVVDWLDESEENVREFMALHKLNDISLLNKQYTLAKKEQSRKTVPVRKIVLELMKIAAIFLLIWGGMKITSPSFVQDNDILVYQTIYAPAGQRAEILLPDSTKVWLNASSKLTYPTHFDKGRRRIELDGEAYFDVSPDKNRPFIVETQKMSIEVLGTEFNVISYNDFDWHEVSLVEGSVELKIPGLLAKGYLMKENENLKLQDNKLISTQMTDHEYLKWKEGVLYFNNETVEAIINKLRLYFDVNIEIKNTNLMKLRYTGKFRTKDGVEQVLKVLQLEHKFTYSKNSEQNLITIN